MESLHAIVLCFLTTMALLVIHCSGQCSFEYLTQPPSTTLQCCNPYQNGTILVSLECTVRRAVGASANYSIRWFRENTTGAVKDLGLGGPVFQLNRDRTSSYHDVVFLNQPYSPSLLGKYWCQVINTTGNPLMRSNVFTLLAPGDYSEPTCTAEVQTVNNIACADQPAHSSQIASSKTQTVCIVSTITSSGPGSTAIVTSLMDITSHTAIITTTLSSAYTAIITTTLSSAYTAIITTTLSSAYMSPVVTTPTQISATPQSPIIIVIAVIGVVIVVISVVSVTVIVILFIKWRQSVNSNKETHSQRDHQTLHAIESEQNTATVVNDETVIKERQGQHTSNKSTRPITTTYDAVQYVTCSDSDYQPLDTVTTDYTSMYTTPTGRREPPSMEVEGKMYSIVNPIKRETNTTYDTAMKEDPYYI